MDTPFVLFGTVHLLSLLACGGLAASAYTFGNVLRRGSGTAIKSVAAAIAVVLVSVEVVKAWLAVEVYGQAWTESLPLHLCRLSALFCAVMLVFRSYRLFEVVYFWGIGGSIPALLTPDLANNFPHPRFLSFFIGHATILSGVLFAVGAFGFRPHLRSIGVMVLVSACVTFVIALVNLTLDTNYFYLCAKPGQPSLFDFLGPWPWYIVNVWIIGLVVAFLCYAPFAIRDLKRTDLAPP